ncbi:hypothetical protein WICPIJ_005849 [Wickerhamomyces pijperi]|uniref:Uncharacterized protein n=1 Tax=Wickerhamomyces pijperi TaxID=599730 RepID=A0A9P8TLK6_WICPI|nr:hypothetical protein WICPIJ_005849 [Wickerhamomyces pijperi]
MACLKFFNPMDVTSMPSILMYPVSGSRNLNKAVMMVDFPAPVLPTIPILLFGSTSKETFLMTFGKWAAYLKERSDISNLPSCGQLAGGSLSGTNSAGSSSISKYSFNLSTEFIAISTSAYKRTTHKAASLKEMA